MKSSLILLLITLASHSFAQNKLLNIEDIDRIDGNKIVLISADWCSICPKAKSVLQSKNIGTSLKDCNAFAFEFDMQTEKEIKFNGTVYYYVPNGMSSGSHQLVHQFLNEQTSLAPPYYVLINEKNEIIQTHHGLLNESDVSDFICGETHLR